VAQTTGVLVGEATSGLAAIEQAGLLHPALVLMDINMPGMNGIEATRRIVAGDPGVVVVLCSTYAIDDLPADAMNSGARAYLNKEDFGPAVLRRLWDERDNGIGPAAGSTEGSSPRR
jgi:two-component system invasion response regulator UvrY